MAVGAQSSELHTDFKIERRSNIVLPETRPLSRNASPRRPRRRRRSPARFDASPVCPKPGEKLNSQRREKAGLLRAALRIGIVRHQHAMGHGDTKRFRLLVCLCRAEFHPGAKIIFQSNQPSESEPGRRDRFQMITVINSRGPVLKVLHQPLGGGGLTSVLLYPGCYSEPLENFRVK